MRSARGSLRQHRFVHETLCDGLAPPQQKSTFAAADNLAAPDRRSASSRARSEIPGPGPADHDRWRLAISDHRRVTACGMSLHRRRRSLAAWSAKTFFRSLGDLIARSVRLAAVGESTRNVSAFSSLRLTRVGLLGRLSRLKINRWRLLAPHEGLAEQYIPALPAAHFQSRAPFDLCHCSDLDRSTALAMRSFPGSA